MAAVSTELLVPEDLSRHYEELAQASGLRREDVMLEALETYLTARMEEDTHLAAAIAAVDRGEIVDVETLNAEAALRARGISGERLHAIGAEMRAEIESEVPHVG